jgi:hypothetical protein
MQAYVHSLAEEMDERIQGYAGISNPIGTAIILTYSVCVEVPEADAHCSAILLHVRSGHSSGHTSVTRRPALFAGPDSTLEKQP